MVVDYKNIGKIEYYCGMVGRPIEYCSALLSSLLDDLEELNWRLLKRGFVPLVICYEDKHTSYSPERVEPCPDYYGSFTLRWASESGEKVGDFMCLEQLDLVMCTLSDFSEKAI